METEQLQAKVLEVEDICASYGKKQVLHEVSLSAGPGELVSVIGPNGAGKSTLLKVIAGTIPANKGKILLESKDISHLMAYSRAELGIAYSLQGARVFPSLTVEENIWLGGCTHREMDRELLKGTILPVFPELKGFLHRRAGLLSGGERQAVALSMVFVRESKLLLLDEPSAGLSPKLAASILKKVNKVCRKRAIPTILVEQRVREALRISDRVVVMMEGAIALESGNPMSLLEGEKLDQLFFGGR